MSGAFNFATVILAAGASSRMGEPKLLLPWHGTTIVGHLLAQWKALGATKIAVVTATDNRLIEDELDRLQLPLKNRIRNNDPNEGMFSSVRCAAAWPHWPDEFTHFVVSLGDQPHLKRDTLEGLLQFAATHQASVCQPAFNGRPRHPVVLPRNAFMGIADCPEETLKQYLARTSVAAWDCHDQGLDLDIDRTEDYARALKLDLGSGG